MRRIGPQLLAVARPLLPRFPELPEEESRRVERELEAFLAAQTGAMPRHLRVALRAALALFTWLPALRWGRPYAALAPSAQQRVVLAWSVSAFGPLRDFVKLVRSLALFFYLDHPAVVARLEAETGDGALRSDATRAR